MLLGIKEFAGRPFCGRFGIQCIGVWISVRLLYIRTLCSWRLHAIISCLHKVKLVPDSSECNYCLSQGVSVSIFLLHVVSKYLSKFGFLVLQNVVSSFIIWQRVAHSSLVSSVTSKIRRLYVILKLKVYTDRTF